MSYFKKSQKQNSLLKVTTEAHLLQPHLKSRLYVMFMLDCLNYWQLSLCSTIITTMQDGPGCLLCHFPVETASETVRYGTAFSVCLSIIMFFSPSEDKIYCHTPISALPEGKEQCSISLASQPSILSKGNPDFCYRIDGTTAGHLKLVSCSSTLLYAQPWKNGPPMIQNVWRKILNNTYK